MVDEAIEIAAMELHAQYHTVLEPLSPVQSWDMMTSDRKQKYRLAAMRVVDAFHRVVETRKAS